VRFCTGCGASQTPEIFNQQPGNVPNGYGATMTQQTPNYEQPYGYAQQPAWNYGSPETAGQMAAQQQTGYECINGVWYDEYGREVNVNPQPIPTMQQPYGQVITTTTTTTTTFAPAGAKGCNKWTAFLLCFFFGFWGAHKFYEGKIALGLFYIFTLGFLGIGWLIDLIVILTRPEIYYV